MAYFLGFNALMILLGAGIAAGIVPVGGLTPLVKGLHYAIGITTPTAAEVRRAVVIWLVSMLVIVDMMYALLVWVL